MSIVYLGIGTNLGNKKANIESAIQYLKEQIGKEVSRSALFVTEPWGFHSNNTFINIAASFNTTLSPQDVLTATQLIEKQMGRTHKSVDRQYKDRIIDIDILLYDDLILNQPNLVIPHPLMAERLFVMQPLAEIAPNLAHPVLHTTISELLKALQ